MTTNQIEPKRIQITQNREVEPSVISSRQLWLAAIKPPIYSVAVVPILTGTAIAYSEGYFSALVCGTFLTSAILIIAWLNLSNDVFDADTGIDVNKAHSVVNLTGNQSLIFWLSNICLFLGGLGIMLISWWQQDPTVVAIILVCCALGYAYQGPPFRLGYLGLGEIICFFTFGPGAVAAAYYAQTQRFSKFCFAVSILVGISTSIILFCSHFHQVEDDLAAGKKSPIVRMGTANGSKVLAIAVGSFYFIAIASSLLGYFPSTVLFVALSIPFAWRLVHRVMKYHDIPKLVCNSKFLAVNFYLASSLLLGIGLLVAK